MPWLRLYTLPWCGLLVSWHEPWQLFFLLLLLSMLVVSLSYWIGSQKTEWSKNLLHVCMYAKVLSAGMLGPPGYKRHCWHCDKICWKRSVSGPNGFFALPAGAAVADARTTWSNIWSPGRAGGESSLGPFPPAFSGEPGRRTTARPPDNFFWAGTLPACVSMCAASR